MNNAPALPFPLPIQPNQPPAMPNPTEANSLREAIATLRARIAAGETHLAPRLVAAMTHHASVVNRNSLT